MNDTSDAVPVFQQVPPGAQAQPIVAVEPYGYNTMQQDIQQLLAKYPFLERQVIGYTVLGREIPAIRLGRGPRQVLYHGTTHSREWITSLLLMRFIEDYASAYAAGQLLGDTDIRRLYDVATIWIIPMVNPDGVDLVLNGLKPTNPYYQQLLRWNRGNTDFSEWKANARGVDINRNFAADWEVARRVGARVPGPEGYAGPAPESEPETQALVRFSLRYPFQLVLAYHAMGEVIYWGYRDIAEQQSKDIATRLGRLSGYLPIKAAKPGGYKEWFMLTTRRPSMAPEVGHGTLPVPLTQFPTIYSENLPILLDAPLISGPSRMPAR